MRLRVLIGTLGCLMALAACTGRAERNVDQWLGREIVIPADLVYTRYGSDTVPFSTAASDYTVLMYVDTAGCVSCRLQLERWRDWMEYVRRESPYNVSFLFDFYPKDESELRDLLLFHRFDAPVCIDREDRLNRTNGFPEGWQYHTFLLDSAARVVLMGNPVNNQEVAELYRQVLVPADEASEKKLRETEVFIPREEIVLDGVAKDSIRARFVLRNVGTSPLTIEYIETGCDCTFVGYPDQPVLSGDSAVIEMRVKKESPGCFEETIFVYGNFRESPAFLTLKGEIF